MIALFPDACHTPGTGLDVVAMKWKCVLVTLGSRSSSIMAYLKCSADVGDVLMLIS